MDPTGNPYLQSVHFRIDNPTASLLEKRAGAHTNGDGAYLRDIVAEAAVYAAVQGTHHATTHPFQ